MRAFFIILTFCSSFASKAQKIEQLNFVSSQLVPNVLFLSFKNETFAGTAFNKATPSLLMKANKQHLPFFCNMEDKFRNRFHVYLKLRAGNDDVYEKMITKPHNQPL